MELRVEDVDEAEAADGYPGYTSITNSKYKTSTIYGEKLIVIPNCIFEHLKIYRHLLRQQLNTCKSNYLFVATQGSQMSHGAIGSALSSSFRNAKVFNDNEYKRVCPTRIRIACATFGCKQSGIDAGYFAKHFMKNKEDTTNIYYNLFSNHREALKLAMMMGDTFEVGGKTHKVEKSDVEELTNAIYACERQLPTKEEVLNWVKGKAEIDSKEMAEFVDVLSELDVQKPSAVNFYSKSDNNSSSDQVSKVDFNMANAGVKKEKKVEVRKEYPKRQRQEKIQKSPSPESEEDDVTKDADWESESDDSMTDGEIHNTLQGLPEDIRKKYSKKKEYDLARSGRVHDRSIYLMLSAVCKNLIARPDFASCTTTRTFTEQEVANAIDKDSMVSELLAGYGTGHWKYLVLNLRNKCLNLARNGKLGDWQAWLAEANELLKELKCKKNRDQSK